MRTTFILVLLIGCHAMLEAQHVLSGIVKERKTGQIVIGAHVGVYADSAARTPLRQSTTNAFGFFSLPGIPDGRHLLIVHSLGLKTEITRVILSSDKTETAPYSIELDEDPVQLEGITVEAAHQAQVPAAMSTIGVSRQLLQVIPSLGAESDLFRALQLLPGVKSSSEVSSGLYIRGGSADQNLILLDGATVYNPYHLAGFLSSFNTDALLNVRLIKGVFPAEYGGRLSSVIDLMHREGTKEAVTGKGSLSLIASRLTLEGPVTEDMTFMVSGRRMYLDLLVAMAGKSKDAPDYYFYDLNAKLNYSFSPRDRIFLSAYTGQDVLTGPPKEKAVIDVNWGNKTVNFRWMHIMSPSLFTNVSLIYTDYHFSAFLQNRETASSLENFHTLSQIRDLQAKAELQYSLNEDHLIKAGIDVISHAFTADASAVYRDQVPTYETHLKSIEGAAYIQDDWTITPLLTAQLGARAEYFQAGAYRTIEPRASLAFAVTDKTKLKAGYSLTSQFLHLISRDDIAIPTDMWFPSTSTILPGRARQSVAGVETLMGEDEYLISLEGYYKEMENVYAYRDKADFTLGQPLETQFVCGSGKAYGAEVFVNKRMGAFTGWLGYTLSWVRHTIPELNSSKPFYPSYDKRHDISLVLNYKLGGRWELGASWTFQSGQAMTVPYGFYSFRPIDGPFIKNKLWESKEYTPERNTYRLPPYHRLDLNFLYHTTVFGLESELTFNIYNVYNRQNVFSALVETDMSKDPPRNKLDAYTLFPVIPTVGWNFKF